MRYRTWRGGLLGLAIIGGTAGCLSDLTGLLPGLGGGGLVGGGFNLPPTAVITVDLVRGIVPLRVSFSSNRSTDDGLIVSRQWNFGDGTTSPEISPSHVYTATGTYTVTLTLTDDDGAVSTDTETIQVTEAPVARISVDTDTLVNAPGTIMFDASDSFDPDGSIVSYSWDFGDGSRETLETVPHTYAASGTYRVTLTVTDDIGITDRDEITVRVGIQQPAIEFRTPPADAGNLVVPLDAPLWVRGDFEVEAGVPRTITAGLDRDEDLCDASSLLLTLDTLAEALSLDGHLDRITDVRYSIDDSRVLSSSVDGTVRIFDAVAGAELTAIGVGAVANAVSFSTDGEQFAVALASGNVSLRSATTGGVVRTLTGHTDAVNDVAHSANGFQIISGSDDATAIIWSVATGQVVAVLPHAAAVTAVAASPENPDQLVTGAADGEIAVWNESGDLVLSIDAHTDQVNDLAISPDGELLASAGADGEARLWDIDTGTLLRVISDHDGAVTAVTFSADGALLITGGADAFVRVFEAASGASLARRAPCDSPIGALTTASDGESVLVGVAAATAIQLDTAERNGNDLNFTVPQALQLRNVPALNRQSVPLNTYSLFVEIDTDRTDPTRIYADATVQVVAPFGSDLQDVAVVPLVDDAAQVIVNPRDQREVVDLGPVAAGDRLFLSLLSTPGFAEVYRPADEFSVMLLTQDDGAADAEIFAWFQRNEDLPSRIFLDRESRLIFSRDADHLYAVVDGGQSIQVRFEREAATPAPLRQRIFVNFDGGEDIGVGNRPPRGYPPLRIQDFFFFDADAATATPAQNQALRDAIRAVVLDRFADFDIDFTFSDEGATSANAGSTVFVGGNDSFEELLGLADFVDPRNDTQFGFAVTFATTVAEHITDNPGVANGASAADSIDANIPRWGAAIGQETARQIGFLLGLRNTSNNTDLMFGTFQPGVFGDPTVARQLGSGPPIQFAQLFALPPVGVQNARQLLADTVGCAGGGTGCE